ncbi:MAG: PDGLE domain-containing protein [Actinomycetota bacterium]|nr:PDGLE domain-containing protein [Actinomycetota bacterium]
MTAAHRRRSPTGFFAAFGLIALLIAGLLSYLASANPDGLDSATLNGCQVTEVSGTEQLSGECIAQNARDHDLAGSPLADYTLGGDDGLVGIAGVIGVLVTLAVAGGLFWLARPPQGRGVGKRPAAKP